MRTFWIILLMTMMGLPLTGCEGQTALPKELPPNAEIIYVSEGGLLPDYLQLIISDSVMTVSHAPAEVKQTVWQAKLSADDLKTLYQAFLENKFDSIRPNKEIMVADGKYRSIELKFGGTRFYAVRGDGIETTEKSGERFNKVEDALSSLVKKYGKQAN